MYNLQYPHFVTSQVLTPHVMILLAFCVYSANGIYSGSVEALQPLQPQPIRFKRYYSK